MAYTSDKEIHQLNAAATLTGAELVPIALTGQEATMTTTQDIADLAMTTNWNLTGNTGTIAGINFLGTTDDSNLLITNKRATNGIGTNITIASGNGVGTSPSRAGGSLYLSGGNATGVATPGDVYIGGGNGLTYGNVIMGFVNGNIGGGQVSKVGIGTIPNYLLDVLADAAGVFAANIYNVNTSGAGLGVSVNHSDGNYTVFQALGGSGGNTSLFDVRANGQVIMPVIPEYANRTAATSAGLTTGMIYKLPISGDNKVLCIV